MQKFYRWISKHREIIMAIVDITIVIFSYWFAYFVRTDFGKEVIPFEHQTLWKYMYWLIITNLASILLFQLNKSLWMFISVDEALRVAMAVFVGNFAWWLGMLLVKIPWYVRSVPVIAGMIQLLLMLGLRLMYRVVRRDSAQRHRSHRAVILGAGSAGVTAMREITYSDLYDTRIIGFIDKNKQKVKKRLSGVVVLGTDDDMPRIVKQYNIDTAYIAIKNITQQDLREMIERCRQMNLRTKIVSFELQNNVGERASVRNVNINDLLGRGELYLNNEEIGGYLTGKTIMVTGAGGSIGSELVRQIMQFTPKRLVLLDIYENNMYDLQQEINIERRRGHGQNVTDVICLIGSVRDKKRVDEIMKKYHPNVVFHAAAHKHVPLVESSPLEAIKNNVLGTKNVVECCIMNYVDKFVMISTDKAVRTTNVMGATKRMCELIV